MATATKRTRKHSQLDSAKIKRSQRALHAKMETEAIERALNFAIAEHEKNRLVLQATARFVKSGIETMDAKVSHHRQTVVPAARSRTACKPIVLSRTWGSRTRVGRRFCL